MSPAEKIFIKSKLHPRNRNREPYDLKSMVKVVPELKHHIKLNKYGVESVDFADPATVKILNQALLNLYYGIKNWNFPDKNLCPPIPGRADYLHHLADLKDNDSKLAKTDPITVLDIGTGASLIYPILGVIEYNWHFIATDIDADSLASAEKIIEANPALQGKVELRIQKNPNHIFEGIITTNDKIEFTMCNPPFHASRDAALQGTRRKVQNLSGSITSKPLLNFAGLNNELITAGGEAKFIKKMILESKKYKNQCNWFSTLVSKKEHLKGIYKLLKKTEVSQQKTIPMGTSNKSSRIVAWTFNS